MALSRLVKIVFLVLLMVILGELMYYSNLQSKLDRQKKNNLTIPQIKKASLSNEDLAILNDSHYQELFHLSYDQSKDKFCYDMSGKAYVQWRKTMLANYASINGISSYTKDLVDSLIAIDRIKGTISDKDTSKIIDGEKFLFFNLKTDQGRVMNYLADEKSIKKTKFVKMINDVEVPMKIDELKNGDKIIREGTTDLTKPPTHPEFIIGIKIIKL